MKAKLETWGPNHRNMADIIGSELHKLRAKDRGDRSATQIEINYGLRILEP